MNEEKKEHSLARHEPFVSPKRTSASTTSADWPGGTWLHSRPPAFSSIHYIRNDYVTIPSSLLSSFFLLPSSLPSPLFFFSHSSTPSFRFDQLPHPAFVPFEAYIHIQYHLLTLTSFSLYLIACQNG